MNENNVPGELYSELYNYDSVIGKGGFGLILKLIEKSSKKEIAAKVMKIEINDDKGIVDNELLLLTRGMEHRNIVKIFNHHQYQNWHMLTMELGMCNLLEEFNAEKLKKNKGLRFGLPFEHILRVLFDILDALIYTSEKKISYRDIKPSNVLKFADCYKLTDWGTAYQKQEMEMTNTFDAKMIDVLTGTFLYMSPEIAAELSKGLIINDLEKDSIRVNLEKCDVFSLGILIMEIYYGLSHKELREFKKDIMDGGKEIGVFINDLNRGRESPDHFGFIVSEMLSLDYRFRPTLIDLRESLRKLKDEETQQRNENSKVKELETHEIKGLKKSKITTKSKKTVRATATGICVSGFFRESILIYRSEWERTIKAVNRKANKYMAIDLITFNKFFDFKINENFFKIMSSSQRKYKIISVSGLSGIGKSMTMNLLISLIYRKISANAEIAYVDVFKVGSGAKGETTGINCNIINLSPNFGLVILDMQGSNDDRDVENFKFLYYSLFFFAFLISDIHFYFYQGNNTQLKNSDIQAVIAKKTNLIEKAKNPNIWEINTELIPVNTKLEKNMSTATLDYYKREHHRKAVETYGNQLYLYKGNMFFLPSNSHFSSLSDSSKSCISSRLICKKCQKKEPFFELDSMAQYVLDSSKTKLRDFEKIKDNIAVILEEMHQSRYFICFSAHLGFNDDQQFVTEYLNNVKWVHNIQTEKIDIFDFGKVFSGYFDSTMMNISQESAFLAISELIKKFARIYLTSFEFSRFIEKNLMENGNNILRKEEAIFLESHFMAKYRIDMKDFKEAFQENMKSLKGEKQRTMSKLAKEKLIKTFAMIRGQQKEERKERKLGFWERMKVQIKGLFGMSTLKDKFMIIKYLLLSIESIEEIIKAQAQNTDKYEIIFTICGLLFINWLISEDMLKKIADLIDSTQKMIQEITILVNFLQKKANEAGYKKNKDIQKLLISIQSLIEKFLEDNRQNLKIMMISN